MQRGGWWLFLVAPVVVAVACGGSDDASIGNPDGNGDGGGDGTAAGDAQPTDAASDGLAPVVTTYNDFTSAAFWQFHDFSALLGQADGGPIGYLGCLFDGKYMYYTPTGRATSVGTVTSNNFAMLRYDTTAAFDDDTAYLAADLARLGSGIAFIGATFDGRYLYPAPYVTTPFTRYDTKGSFTDLDASWNFGGNATSGHFGAIFDGSHVYYAPISGRVVQRFDIQDSGFVGFDTSTIDGGDATYQGVVFDGRYAYFVPSNGVTPGDASHVLRLDTTLDFNAPSSWSTFDTRTLDPAAQDFTGGVFDGRYLYLTPTTTAVATTTDVRFVRFDTRSDFSKASSWQAYAPTPDAQALGYHTAGFDGRYVYYLPFVATGPFPLLRFDTRASFTSEAAWTTIDTTTLNPGATGFEGVGFDGRYVYLVPRYGKVAARFDAKSPPSIPAGFLGSFL